MVDVGRWRRSGQMTGGGWVGGWRTASLASSGLFHDHWYEVGHRRCGGPGLCPRACPGLVCDARAGPLDASARPAAVGTPRDAATHRSHTADCGARQVDGPVVSGPSEASTTAVRTGLFACAAGSAGLRALRELKKRLRWSVRLSRSGKLRGTMREDAPRGFMSSSVDVGRPRGLTGFSWRPVVTNKAAPSIVPSTSVVQKQQQQRPGLVPSSTIARVPFGQREALLGALFWHNFGRHTWLTLPIVGAAVPSPAPTLVLGAIHGTLQYVSPSGILVKN